MPPHGRRGSDFDSVLTSAVPAGYDDCLPTHAGIREHSGQVWQPSAFSAQASDRAGRTQWGWLVQGCIQLQAGDCGDTDAAHRIEEQQCGEAAVADQDEIAVRQSATGLEGELASDVEQGLVPTALLAAGAFGRHRCGEERQGPDPSGPSSRYGYTELALGRWYREEPEGLHDRRATFVAEAVVDERTDVLLEDQGEDI